MIKNIYVFYKHDCCWPYAVSFYITLVIYGFDFFGAGTRFHWASPVAYGVLLAYFLYNVHLYFQGKIQAKNPQFALAFLSFKVTVLGSVLFLLYAMR
ncbi:MAG: hypothetical protein ABH891_02465 [Candidatus Omnitrophota bacterium]